MTIAETNAAQDGPVKPRTVAIIGGGPAGLMAAETLAARGVRVDVYDAMPSVGRKFLLAGKGGMNLTHSEPAEWFRTRYGARQPELEPMLDAFGPNELRAWADGLGVATFVGSSGRVFPTDMKAAPLLRAWLHRLRESGVSFHMRHRWQGWDKRGGLHFLTPDGAQTAYADATVLALGGGSWARLGSDGAWVPLLEILGVEVAPLQPANCGFNVAWTDHFRLRFAGHPLKSVALSFTDVKGIAYRRQGELMVTNSGIEGSLVYESSGLLRDKLAAQGQVRIKLDLAPDWPAQRVLAEVARPRGSRSLSTHLQSRVNIGGIKAGLLREALTAQEMNDPARLAETIKALPLTLLAPRPLNEAISSAGGVMFEALDHNLMLRARPGVFCAGEMLDWEAPTGGYLLTACFASGVAAGKGVLDWLGLAEPANEDSADAEQASEPTTTERTQS
ncbi:MAG: TIGR03862 family flavoprotein [Burkholderiaceae bacterium]|nr:TIGR03862 family flavoprotein [Burkholderiaceae bacterium]